MKNSLKNQVLYQVYTRNFSVEGTFEGVKNELSRIKDLGVNILYLLPFHEMGKKNRKGVMGSPYAIKDYRSIASEYGTLEDLKELISETHKNGMKFMMDIVFNHTSPDHIYVSTHPEWYYRKPNGEFGNKIGDWWDIQDLDTFNQELQDELLDVLKYWQSIGVDGIRCDVASFVPIEFWERARKELKSVNDEFIMVAESVDPSFMEALRENGFYCSTDSKTFETFDSLYDYDLYPTWKSVVVGERPLSDYVTLLNHQHSKFNRNDYKLRFFENHDQERIFNLVSESKAKTWIAFMFFLKGWILIFNGIETKSKKLPDLFNKDVIEFDNTDDEMVLFIKELIGIKHSFDDKVIKQFEVKLIEGVITINYTFRNTDEEWLGLFDVDQVGVFNLEGNYSDLKTDDKYKGKFEMKKTYYLLRKE